MKYELTQNDAFKSINLHRACIVWEEENGQFFLKVYEKQF